MFFQTLKTLSDYEDEPSLLIFSSGIGTGGAEVMLLRLAKHFRKKRHQVYIVNLTRENTLENEFAKIGVQVFSLPILNPIVFLTKSFLLLRVLKEKNPIAVIGWMYLGCIVASLFKTLLPRTHKLFWSVRQSLSFWHSEKLLTRIVIRLACVLSQHPNKIIYNSNLAKSQHIKFGFSKDNAHYIPNGFDILSEKELILNKTKYRNEFGLKKTDLIIGMVGRYHAVKGHDLFCKMVQTAWPDKLPSNLKFVLIGEGIDENLRAKLPQSLLEQRCIILSNRRSDAAKIMCSFDALLVTSYAEAFPNVVGEAMVAKIPVISSNVGDVPLILPSDRGIFKVGKLDELNAQIREFCSLYKGDRLAWGNKNRDRIRLYYDVKNIVLSYSKIFGIN